jgi:hypothetical protein
VHRPFEPVFMGRIAGVGKTGLRSPRIGFGQRGPAGARSGHRPPSAQPPTRLPEELNAWPDARPKSDPRLFPGPHQLSTAGFKVHDLPPAVVTSGHTRHGSHRVSAMEFWAGLPRPRTLGQSLSAAG